MAANAPAAPSPVVAPSRNTMSPHSTELVRGTHQFSIAGYSLQKRTGAVGKIIRSGSFEVGSYNWAIRCYPAGEAKQRKLLSTATKKATAKFSFQIIGPAGRKSTSSVSWHDFTPDEITWGHGKFMTLESVESTYLKDDRLTISCAVEVQKQSTAVATRNRHSVTVPPSCIAQDLAGLFESKQGSDVTFQIGENAYDAHKLVVAMRSPLSSSGHWANNNNTAVGRSVVTVPDMKPATFKAMLHFIYTDKLPPVAEDDELVREGSAKRAKTGQKSAGCSTKESHRETICDWLVAADRYDLERMTLMCESLLSETIDSENAAATLQLADKHHCPQLKAFCVDYITSPGVLKAVLATEGYKELRENCPSVLADVLERLEGADSLA
ncbi:hypothetical protein BRADI_3g35513v3 [Brachypodium distachyon]|uniref:BTB domain-containing protein n=1 Tax=Brachypodium distachyon TaxID=15368 RepID=A0A0Q3FF01_BRADI|nr:hypothetical protein BRADI_3g35513v3 [Brachypodium distachyon]